MSGERTAVLSVVGVRPGYKFPSLPGTEGGERRPEVLKGLAYRGSGEGRANGSM